ncbi:hypothetical protein PSEUDO8Z_160054 [Pseudomonas sp. 8Z]|uniref:hypothetical protein n=1 Tax=Pseudomonas sp. 8Z TaxID=2653166 RepID=UPI0012F1BF51|nr:hypothetical protein [Pseudomonas sp. 8Z]VXC65874.1 hypothetical protein PSEUDO8Z_160054 [Pseudomonas sp. 8Z]
MSEKRIVKITETKFPFGLRVAKSADVVILDFMNERDDDVMEVFSSIAVSKSVAKDIIKNLEAAFPDISQAKSTKK